MLIAALLLQVTGGFPPPTDPLRVTAVRTRTAMVIDGRLDEPVWQQATPATGWRKNNVDQGAPASAPTDVRVAYDAQYIYVAFVARDSVGVEPPRVRNLQRDFRFDENDVVSVVFDPFRDQRSGQIFQVTPAGNQRDSQLLVGQGIDQEWDVPWRARTTVSDSGWTAELAIPWSSLRYPDGARTWGVNFYRGLRRKNEVTTWSPVPRGLSFARTDYAGLLDGLEPPRARTPVQLQPYVRTRVGRFGVPGAAQTAGDAGGEVKWQPSAGTVVDLTVNTDFAQAEVDRQVVNLTRFSPFFPERRQFFLENRALFAAGVAGRIQPFFSRSIGRGEDGTPVPIAFGARFIRRTSRANSGMLFVRQGRGGALASSDVGVARGTVNLGAQTRLGAMIVGRRDAVDGTDDRLHGTAVVDAFSQLTPTLGVAASVSATQRSLAGGNGVASNVSITQAGRSLYTDLTAEVVGKHYQPEAGFVARQDYGQVATSSFFDLRPSWLPASVRSYSPTMTANLIHRASTREFQEAHVAVSPLAVQWQSAASASLGVDVNWQRLDVPFTLVPGIQAPAGDYAFTRATASLGSNPAGVLAWSLSGSAGRYFDGALVRAEGAATWTPDPRVAIRLSYTPNQLRGYGDSSARATTHLVAPELRLAINPRIQLTGFYQYNTAVRQGSLNVRGAWEFAPLSFLYVVWNNRRQIDGLLAARGSVPADQLTIKAAYLFRR
jgi:hypothetical protein